MARDVVGWSVLFLLLSPVLFVPGISATPSDIDAGFTLGVDLETHSIEMLASSEEDTMATVVGWVAVDSLLPGETVSVDVEVTVYQDLYPTPDPSAFVFREEGRRYFNLNMTLLEDSQPTDEYKVVVTASGSSYRHSAVSNTELVVVPVYEHKATATLVSQPGEVEPGGSTSGVVEIVNTGSIGSEYKLVVRSDPDGVVEWVVFEPPPSLSPLLSREVRFTITVAEGAVVGTHRVRVGLVATDMEGAAVPLDEFSVDLRVGDPGGMALQNVVPVVIIIIVAVAIGAYLVRRKV